MNQFIVEMTATGGIMIAAIGLNLLGFIKIKVANLLPGILVVGIIVSLIYSYGLIVKSRGWRYRWRNFNLQNVCITY